MSTASELDWQKGEVRKYEDLLRSAEQKVRDLERQLDDERRESKN